MKSRDEKQVAAKINLGVEYEQDDHLKQLFQQKNETDLQDMHSSVSETGFRHTYLYKKRMTGKEKYSNGPHYPHNIGEESLHIYCTNL